MFNGSLHIESTCEIFSKRVLRNLGKFCSFLASFSKLSLKIKREILDSLNLLRSGVKQRMEKL